MVKDQLVLIERADSFKNRTAVVEGNQHFSYDQLLSASASTAGYLLKHSQDLKGARIAFMVVPGFDYVTVQWAIWRAGGVAVPLCIQHPLPALEYVIDDATVSAIIVSDRFEALLKESARSRGIQLINMTAIGWDKKSVLPIIDKERPAMILYTSGTTSKPKGVVTTHMNIESQVKTLIEAWDWQQDDHVLNILPLHHVHGIINVLTCALWSGAICEFLPKFNAETVWEKFIDGRVNVFMAVPTIYFKLIAFWESSNAIDQRAMSQSCQKFRLMVSGSAALPISVLEKWKKISGHTLLERYGMTEIGMALSNPYKGIRQAGYVGRPLPGVDIRLSTESGEINSDQGEIQVRGPGVFKEYWNKPEATRNAFIDGWFKTGDMAIFDDKGYKILGRNSVDIIKSGGYKISALEIEEVLRTHPSITECAVVGLEDEEWGEVIAVGVVIKESIDLELDTLQNWCKDKLPVYKIPRKLLALEDLPRNTLGKVMKPRLKELFI
ncbi:acyl-CoA synthetase [Fulvivirgaceae bacterium BMA10]|uniref:Acyl-CoA synthetase n=1 Tax=Splendidivirga corallicola TaxID=3051826 RepID=A0ABT8KRP8_9BACT|nr:acyl-CoA synthetase [Fulvivirgaceae bacterium BMA10]